MKTPQVALALFLTLLTTGCVKHYRPLSEKEETEFNQANFAIYPDDVRRRINRYSNQEVAWAGIILESHFVEHEEYTEAVFLVEHHYYDWIEESLPPHMWLSPRGEGKFKTSWLLQKNCEGTKQLGAPGNLLIAYGFPDHMEENAVVLKSNYIRGVQKKFFTTQMIDYGRNQNPSKGSTGR